MSCDDDHDFTHDMLEVLHTCRIVIERYSSKLYKNLMEERGDSSPDLLTLRGEAKKRTTDAAINIIVDRLRPPPSPEPPNLPSTSEAWESWKPSPNEPMETWEIMEKVMESEPLPTIVGKVMESEPTKPYSADACTCPLHCPLLRQPRDECKCQQKCPSKILPSRRQEICRQYRQISLKERKEQYKNLGLIVTHRPDGCGEKNEKTRKENTAYTTYVLYNDARKKVAVCKVFFLTTLGYLKASHLPILNTEPCDECQRLLHTTK